MVGQAVRFPPRGMALDLQSFVTVCQYSQAVSLTATHRRNWVPPLAGKITL
jgi:hypothetical protein